MVLMLASRLGAGNKAVVSISGENVVASADVEATSVVSNAVFVAVEVEVEEEEDDVLLVVMDDDVVTGAGLLLLVLVT